MGRLLTAVKQSQVFKNSKAPLRNVTRAQVSEMTVYIYFLVLE